MSRVVSSGVLLFSLALAMLGFQPTGDSVTLTLTVPVFSAAYYRVFGIGAMVICLFLLVMASRQSWSDKVEKWLENRRVQFVWNFLIFAVYAVSYPKGLAAVQKAGQPTWVVDVVGYFGFFVFIYLAWTVLKYNPKK